MRPTVPSQTALYSMTSMHATVSQLLHASYTPGSQLFCSSCERGEEKETYTHTFLPRKSWMWRSLDDTFPYKTCRYFSGVEPHYQTYFDTSARYLVVVEGVDAQFPPPTASLCIIAGADPIAPRCGAQLVGIIPFRAAEALQ